MTTLLNSTTTLASSHEDLVARLEGRLREIAARLHEEYGSPNLGNKDDPTDEFVFIVLSRKTPERAYVASFDELRGLGTWSEIADLKQSDLEAAIFGGGLEGKKVKAIQEGLREIKKRLSTPDLSKIDHLDDAALFDFLVSLPEIGPKSALCIMLYSFKRNTFPVDAHVGRVLARIGVFEALDVHLMPMDHKQRQRSLRDLVPPDLRYSLHVNLVAHGRAVCKAHNPVCRECVLISGCGYVCDQEHETACHPNSPGVST